MLEKIKNPVTRAVTGFFGGEGALPVKHTQHIRTVAIAAYLLNITGDY